MGFEVQQHNETTGFGLSKLSIMNEGFADPYVAFQDDDCIGLCPQPS
jgi:hypothetical protein